MSIFAIMLIAASPELGREVMVRGIGIESCATAFLPENRLQTESWIVGFWAGWDMALIDKQLPVAPKSDFNGIAGEVDKVCRDEPSTSLVEATLSARTAVSRRAINNPATEMK